MSSSAIGPSAFANLASSSFVLSVSTFIFRVFKAVFWEGVSFSAPESAAARSLSALISSFSNRAVDLAESMPLHFKSSSSTSIGTSLFS